MGEGKFWENLYAKSDDFEYVKALVSDTKFDPKNPKDVVVLALARSCETLHERQKEIAEWIRKANSEFDKMAAFLRGDIQIDTKGKK